MQFEPRVWQLVDDDGKETPVSIKAQADFMDEANTFYRVVVMERGRPVERAGYRSLDQAKIGAMAEWRNWQRIMA